MNLERGMNGWERAWGLIHKKYGSVACLNDECGEVWQYMGTYNGFHQFRHRSLPPFNERGYEWVTIQSDDYERSECNSLYSEV
jgi:UDP-galactopyranose mutase